MSSERELRGEPTWYHYANKRTNINKNAIPHDHDFWPDGHCPICTGAEAGQKVIEHALRSTDITPEEYLIEAAKTDHPDYDAIAARLQDHFLLKVLHAAMGMVTEAGELMDAVKKAVIYGKPLDKVNLKEESGDSFWYQALLARAAGFTFPESMKMNIEKLRARYPGKFTEQAALNRNLERERKILEADDPRWDTVVPLDQVEGE